MCVYLLSMSICIYISDIHIYDIRKWLNVGRNSEVAGVEELEEG